MASSPNDRPGVALLRRSLLLLCLIAIPCAGAATQRPSTEWADYTSLDEDEKASLYLPVLRSVRELAEETWGTPAGWASMCGTTVEEERLRIEVTDSLMASWGTERRAPRPSPDSAAPTGVLPARRFGEHGHGLHVVAPARRCRGHNRCHRADGADARLSPDAPRGQGFRRRVRPAVGPRRRAVGGRGQAGVGNHLSPRAG